MVVAAVAGHVVAKMVVVKHVVAGLRGQHFLRVAKRKIFAFPALPINVFGFNSNFAQISIWEIPSQQSLKQTEKDTIIAISKT